MLRGEDEEELASVRDPQMLLSRATTAGAFSQTQLLKYLVPWGDAVFNHGAGPGTSRRHSSSNDPRTLHRPWRRDSSRLVLVERLAKGTHSYLWFIGD